MSGVHHLFYTFLLYLCREQLFLMFLFLHLTEVLRVVLRHVLVVELVERVELFGRRAEVADCWVIPGVGVHERIEKLCAIIPHESLPPEVGICRSTTGFAKFLIRPICFLRENLCRNCFRQIWHVT